MKLVIRKPGTAKPKIKVEPKIKLEPKLKIKEESQEESLPKIDESKKLVATFQLDDILIPSTTLVNPSMLKDKLVMLEGLLADEGVPLPELKHGLASIRHLIKGTPELAAELLEEDIGLITRVASHLTDKKLIEVAKPKARKKRASTVAKIDKLPASALDDDDLAGI